MCKHIKKSIAPSVTGLGNPRLTKLSVLGTLFTQTSFIDYLPPPPPSCYAQANTHTPAHWSECFPKGTYSFGTAGLRALFSHCFPSLHTYCVFKWCWKIPLYSEPAGWCCLPESWKLHQQGLGLMHCCHRGRAITFLPGESPGLALVLLSSQ